MTFEEQVADLEFRIQTKELEFNLLKKENYLDSLRSAPEEEVVEPPEETPLFTLGTPIYSEETIEKAPEHPETPEQKIFQPGTPIFDLPKEDKYAEMRPDWASKGKEITEMQGAAIGEDVLSPQDFAERDFAEAEGKGLSRGALKQIRSAWQVLSSVSIHKLTNAYRKGGLTDEERKGLDYLSRYAELEAEKEEGLTRKAKEEQAGISVTDVPAPMGQNYVLWSQMVEKEKLSEKDLEDIYLEMNPEVAEMLAYKKPEKQKESEADFYQFLRRRLRENIAEGNEKGVAYYENSLKRYEEKIDEPEKVKRDIRYEIKQLIKDEGKELTMEDLWKKAKEVPWSETAEEFFFGSIEDLPLWVAGFGGIKKFKSVFSLLKKTKKGKQMTYMRDFLRHNPDIHRTLLKNIDKLPKKGQKFIQQSLKSVGPKSVLPAAADYSAEVAVFLTPEVLRTGEMPSFEEYVAMGLVVAGFRMARKSYNKAKTILRERRVRAQRTQQQGPAEGMSSSFFDEGFEPGVAPEPGLRGMEGRKPLQIKSDLEKRTFTDILKDSKSTKIAEKNIDVKTSLDNISKQRYSKNVEYEFTEEGIPITISGRKQLDDYGYFHYPEKDAEGNLIEYEPGASITITPDGKRKILVNSESLTGLTGGIDHETSHAVYEALKEEVAAFPGSQNKALWDRIQAWEDGVRYEAQLQGYDIPDETELWPTVYQFQTSGATEGNADLAALVRAPDDLVKDWSEITGLGRQSVLPETIQIKSLQKQLDTKIVEAEELGIDVEQFKAPTETPGYFDMKEGLKIKFMRKGKSEEEALAAAEDVLKRTSPEDQELFTELASQERRKAEIDNLTGFKTRDWAERNDKLMDGFDSEGRPKRVVVDGLQIMVDMDSFGIPNKKHGQLMGDQVLSEFGLKMRKKIGDRADIIRIGGEETTILPHSMSDKEPILKGLEALRLEFKKEIFAGGEWTNQSFSAGVGDTFEAADVQMNLAKKAGKDRIFEGGKQYGKTELDTKKDVGTGERGGTGETPGQKPTEKGKIKAFLESKGESSSPEAIEKFIKSGRKLPAEKKPPDIKPKKPGETEQFALQKKNRDAYEFDGKKFWSGSVNLQDGVIEEVHPYKTAQDVDFHHSSYFSKNRLEKMKEGEEAFFYVDESGEIVIDPTERLPQKIDQKKIIAEIEKQISPTKKLSLERKRYYLEGVRGEVHSGLTPTGESVRMPPKEVIARDVSNIPKKSPYVKSLTRFSLEKVEKKVRSNYKGEEQTRIYEVSVYPKELKRIVYKPAKGITSSTQARKINSNPERVKDWQKLYEKAPKVTLLNKIKKKKATEGKMKDVPVIRLSTGCQRTRAIVERVENKLLPPETVLEACYGGSCFVNKTLAAKFNNLENIEVMDLTLVDKAKLKPWFEKKSFQDWLNDSSSGFIRQGDRGDDSHVIASGLAEEWLKNIVAQNIKPKTVFISSSYAPVTDAQYKALEKYKDNFVLHFSTSGWFSKEELMIRLGEYEAARKAGLPAKIRIISNKDVVSDMPVKNEKWLFEKIHAMKVPQEDILETPFHDDTKHIRSQETKKCKNVCCKTGACRTCSVKCLIGKAPKKTRFALERKKKGFDSITTAEWQKISNEMRMKGFDIRGADDAKALVKKRGYKKIQDIEGNWKEAFDKVLGGEKAPAVEKISDVAKKKIIKEFGYTRDWWETGYLTPEGKQLDFSGKKEGGEGGTRALDHRDIGRAYGPGGSEGMINMMEHGYMRVSPEGSGVDLYVPPTTAQRNKLIEYFTQRKGEINLEIGDRAFEAEYPEGTTPRKIFKDIDDFFAGREPVPVSKTAKYRFALEKRPKLDKADIPKEYQDHIADKTKPSKPHTLLQAAGTGLSKALVPISTRLEAISPKLKSRVRKHIYDVNSGANEYRKRAKVLLAKMKKMHPDDNKVLDLALKNRDKEMVETVVNKYGMMKDYTRVRNLLKEMWDKARDAGYEVGWLDDYWPRVIRDKEGLLNKIRGTKDWSVLRDALEQKQKKIDRPLTSDEIIEVTNMVLKGYAPGMSRVPSNVKQRKISKLNSELDQFYLPSSDALLKYIDSINQGIVVKKFFGKHLLRDESGKIDLSNSIGAYTAELLMKNQITSKQENELRGMLEGLFNPGRPGEVMSIFRNLEYIDTMGSPSSALTQIQDIAFAMHNAGVFNALTQYFTKKPIKMEDVSVTKIAQEFAEPSKTTKAVEAVFKATGLAFMDRLGKETLINAAFKKITKQAKQKDAKLLDKLEPIFGDETGLVIDDLVNDKISDNVKYLLFNELADLQPIALSEMPEYYLKSGNLKILYMLKSFTIRQVDVFRKAAFKDIKDAKGPKEKMNAILRLARLAGAFIAMGMVADTAKDMVFGRDFDLEDTVVDNVWKTAGLSKYQIWQFRMEGARELAIKLIAPPFKIIEGITRDYNKLSKGDLKAIESETIGSIPLGGKLFYWWFGKGKQKVLKRRRKKLWEPVSDKRKYLTKYNDLKKADAPKARKYLKEHEDEIKFVIKGTRLKGKYNKLQNLIDDTDKPKLKEKYQKLQDTVVDAYEKAIDELK